MPSFIYLKDGFGYEYGRGSSNLFTMKFSEVLTYIKERFHTKQDEAWMFNEVHEDILNQYAYHIEAKKGALDYIKKCASEKKKWLY